MIGISINNEFLDLPAGTVLEMVRNSPFFSNEEVDGEYSLPLNIPYSDKNYRLLQYIGNHYKSHKKTTIAATLHGGPNFAFTGSLIIDGFDKNNNLASSQITNGLFVFGISTFFQQVKDKKLTDLTLGGVRSFNFTTGSSRDGSGGFWQHVTDMADNPGAYTFVPIKNNDYGHGIEWMNRMTPDNHTTTNDIGDIYNLACCCPGVQLRYVLEKCLTENGWTVEGNILADATFNSIYLQSFRGIYWCDFDLDVHPYAYTPLDIVTFSLNEHLPKDYKITDFIIDVKNKYNIGFNFDTNNKVCTLYNLNAVGTTTVLDLSKYCNGSVKGKFTESSRNICLKTAINDSYPQTLIDTSNAIGVKLFTDLPAAGTVPDDAIYFVLTENVFYQSIGDNTGVKSWHRYADNIGSYNEKDSTETINSNIQSMAQSWQEYRVNGWGYNGNFPTCLQAGNYKQLNETNDWGLIAFIHHGRQLDVRGDYDTSGTALYWYATNTSIDNYGNDLGGWSNVFENKQGAINNGIYKIFYEKWLTFFRNTDSRIFTFSLPEYLLYTLKWEDIIMIKNVRFLIKNMKFNIPYDRNVQMELLKMDM